MPGVLVAELALAAITPTQLIEPLAVCVALVAGIQGRLRIAGSAAAGAVGF